MEDSRHLISGETSSFLYSVSRVSGKAGTPVFSAITEVFHVTMRSQASSFF